MSSGARHGLGAVTGLVVTPLIAGTLLYGTNRILIVSRTFREPPWSDRLVSTALLLAAALLLGLVMGSRLSPLASLVPGLTFAGVGLLWVVSPLSLARDTLGVLPNDLERGYMTLAPTGVLLLLGAALLAASLPPSRWRGDRAAAAHRHAAPMAHGAPPAPVAAPYGTPPPAPGRPAPPQGAVPFASPGSSTPAPTPPQERPRSGAVPFDDDPGRPKQQQSSPDDDQKPGEWTQIYGG